MSRERETYMPVTWQMVELEKEQLQERAFSEPSIGFGVTHPSSPLHGSTLKFQSLFPSFFATSLKTLTVNKK